jgi:hypothetical protein
MNQAINNTHQLIFSTHVKHVLEKVTVYIALSGFLINLALIILANNGLLPFAVAQELKGTPIHAIYTPFSIILFYEVYLFVYHLSDSFSLSIGKQFEIAALIVLRRIFKDISEMELTGSWWSDSHNLKLGSDMMGVVLMFLLILVFYQFNTNREKEPSYTKIEQFILLKKGIALLLIPVLVVLSLYSLGGWLLEIASYEKGHVTTLSEVNYIFYDDFFTVLIVVDIVLLIISFIHTDKFSLVIRNSAFIISTILIRLSFTAENYMGIFLSVTAIAFSVLMLYIFIRYKDVERLR